MPNINIEAKVWELTRSGWFGDAVGQRRKALNLTASELARRTGELGYPISRGAIAKIESNLRSGKVDVAEVFVLSAALDIPPILLLFPQFSADGCAEVLPGVLTPEDEAVRWLTGHVSFPQEFVRARHVSLGSYRVKDRVDTPENDEVETAEDEDKVDTSGVEALLPVSGRLFSPENVRAAEISWEDRPSLPNAGVRLISAASSLEDALETRMALIRQLNGLDEDHDTAKRMLKLNGQHIEAIRMEIRDAGAALWHGPDSDKQEPNSDG